MKFKPTPSPSTGYAIDRQVAIWTFGLLNNSFEDNGHRGLRSCLDVAAALAEQGLRTQIGITSGTAFCGLVGAAYRTEYSVMGPSVNLAARLMCACEKLSVDLLCNDELYREVNEGSREFAFTPFDPVPVKGYDAPVAFYHPHADTTQVSEPVCVSPMTLRKSGL